MSQDHHKGACYGSYEPGKYIGEILMEHFKLRVRSLVLVEPEEINYYNKAEIETNEKEYLNPPFLNHVYLVKGGKLYLADYSNTIIAPITIKVRNKLPEGSEGTFSGTFYGTLAGRFRPATTLDINEDVERLLPAELLSSLKPTKSDPFSEKYIDVKNSSNDLSRDGCFKLLWQLLLSLILLLILLLLVDQGCNKKEGNKKVSESVPCDTIYIRDTVYRTQEFDPEDTIPKTLKVKTDEVHLFVFDCNEEDGDIVSMDFNDVEIFENKSLVNAYGDPYLLKIRKGKNFLRIRVGSLGDEGPCTIGIIIQTVDGRRELFRDCQETEEMNPYELTVRY
ncbi:MAG: hypothetical protein IPP06_09525 [Saprospiraceae bacterium]|nr:hypothetical protein [Candidatus Vicinibacter affinis]